MSDLKSLYLFLKSKGLVKNIKPEYEDTPEEVSDNPAQTSETQNKNRVEFLSWKSTLSPFDLERFNTIFDE